MDRVILSPQPPMFCWVGVGWVEFVCLGSASYLATFVATMRRSWCAAMLPPCHRAVPCRHAGLQAGAVWARLQRKENCVPTTPICVSSGGVRTSAPSTRSSCARTVLSRVPCAIMPIRHGGVSLAKPRTRQQTRRHRQSHPRSNH